MSEIEQEKGNERIITYLLSLLGINTTDGDGKHLHYMAVDQYISENLTNLTYAEIRLAFNLFLQGEFSNYQQFKNQKIYNKLDCIILAKVIEAYLEYKKTALKIYNSKLSKTINQIEQNSKYTESEKRKIVLQGCIDYFNYYKSNKTFMVGKLYVYDVLKEMNLLNQKRSHKLKVLERAKKVYARKRKLKSSHLKKIEIQSYTDKNQEIYYWAKMLMVTDYFHTLIDQNKTLSQIFKNENYRSRNRN